VRRTLAIVLGLTLQAAALNAPLTHAHPDNPGNGVAGHHSERTVHTHWAGHRRSHGTSEGPLIDADDHDRAVFFGAFIAVAPTQLPADGLIFSPFALLVPVERAAHPSVDVTHGHDPPHVGHLPSRAPPALPVLT
jgi:hypothetical protein